MDNIFNKEKGKVLLKKCNKAILDYNMKEYLSGGVILGLSGGADSVALLYLLLKLREETEFNITAIHINHMIRGDEADRDEEFCRKLCNSLDISFISYRVDIPTLANKEHMSIEQTARNYRYKIFNEALSSLGYSSIAVAHNATDNLETIILNMMRGAGISGLSGIPATRDNIIRPLIYLSKDEITALLDEEKIEYVTDRTNLSDDYKRNYVRHKIIPALFEITPRAIEMGLRVSDNLRCDIEFINSMLEGFLKENFKEGKIAQDKLCSLEKALFVRVLAHIIRQKTDVSSEKTHYEVIYKHRYDKSFSYSLPGLVRFVIRGGFVFVEEYAEGLAANIPTTPLKTGINEIEGFDSVIIISNDKSFESYKNVYNIEISAQISSDIINNGLLVRNKLDGDSYSYGGITRRIKKLFNDRKIPLENRNCVPVFADNNGIVWVAGFGVRDEGKCECTHYIAIAEPKDKNSEKLSFYISKRN